MLRKIFNSLIEEILVRGVRYHRRKNLLNLKYLTNDWIGINVAIRGVYEKDTLLCLFDIFSQKGYNSRFIDIGANIGNHTVLASRYFKDVIAFEPNPSLFSLLSLNTQSLTNVKIYNWGIGLKKDKVLLYFNDENFGTGSVVDSQENVDSVTINLRSAKESFALADLDVVKIDVEGYEKHVIRSLFDDLQNILNVIVVVELDRPDNNSDVHEILVGYGFVYCYVVKNGLKERFGLKTGSLVNLHFRADSKYEAVVYSKYKLQ